MVAAPKICVSASVLSLDRTFRFPSFEEEKKSMLFVYTCGEVCRSASQQRSLRFAGIPIDSSHLLADRSWGPQ